MKEAMVYETVNENVVKCNLCPRACMISNEKIGFCGVRKNVNGHLYALTYGMVSSIAIDPIEKKPLYHFYPGISTLSVGTFGCNMRCLHCQNWEISHRAATEDGDGMQNINPAKLINLANENNCKAIVWTYNEPSIWFEYILEVAELAQKEGLLTVLVTAGMINPAPLKKLLKYIDAYRLDVKGFSDVFYTRLTGEPVLQNILDSALIAFDSGVHIEIITNIIPNWNDTDKQFKELSRWIVDELSSEIPWHLTAYHPDNKLSEPPTTIETLEHARSIGIENGLKYVYIGNVHGHTGQNTICPECSKTLINRKGFGVKENHITNNQCSYCGHKIMVYRDFNL